MTETDRPARANRDGHECPPWCQTDHEQVHGPAGTFAFHGGPVTRIEVVTGAASSLPDEITARAFHPGDPRWAAGPVVSVSALRRGTGAGDPHVWLSPGDAEQLAVILGLIDDWDQLGRLVAAIRAAAAQATEGSNG
jgi:hypothetical protein